MSTPAVVFVCGRNSVRSPMAEALWRARFGTDASVRSCGIEPASVADGFMIAVMREAGADLSDFEPCGLDGIVPGPGTRIICLAPEADSAASELAASHGARVEHWHFADPAEIEGGREARLDAYRAIRDALKARINLQTV
ncbi:MAG: arsenate-mycothiol transferase ArsC [Caulobacterales bacterium]|uniref:arsenate-mycothiol transferase ArsC n=1 Tax=Glycocaulis sp. TaxID=1969725 RepID=UPI003F9F94DB